MSQQDIARAYCMQLIAKTGTAVTSAHKTVLTTPWDAFEHWASAGLVMSADSYEQCVGHLSAAYCPPRTPLS